MSAVAEKQKSDLPNVMNAGDSIMAIIGQMACNPNADMDKFERLLAAKERMDAKAAETAFNAAMSEAQSRIGRVSADANNPQTRSRYATYGALDRALRPIYTEHGFALSFDEADGAPEGWIRVVCLVSHKDGFTRTYHKDMPADGKGAKGGDVMTKTHAVGAASSYGMRYLLKMIFNVAIGEDDTDGNEPVQKVSGDQAATLQALAEEVGANIPQFLAYMAKFCKVEIGKFSDIPAKTYAEAVALLNQKRMQK